MPAPRCRDCDAPIAFVECEGSDGKVYLTKFEPVPEAVERSDRGWVKRVTLKRHDCPAKRGGSGGDAAAKRIAELEAKVRQLEGGAPPAAPPGPGDDGDPF